MKKRRNEKADVADLAKTPTGIDGFDEITRGGLPRGRTTLVVGGPGSGKTIFALQTLFNGARSGEPGIFVAFEEKSAQIMQNAASFGWDLEKMSKGSNAPLFVMDTRLSPDTTKAGSFDLTSLLGILEAKSRQMKARRIVFDGIDVLLSLLDNPAAERQEIYRLHDWLMRNELTGVITAKMDGPEADALRSSRYGFMHFMVDCLVVFYHRYEDRASLRRLCVVKYRGSGSSVNEYPFAIGPSGMEVASPGHLELNYRTFHERVSTGVRRLDNMLAGGYFRGTSILISGAPGTGKTTLAGAFAEASCRRGEKTLFISFDEAGMEIIRNLSSVGIRLAPHAESNLLNMYSARTEARSADEHLIKMEALIREREPSVLVIDPISALIKAGGESSAIGIAQRLLRIAKMKGITLLSTTLLGGNNSVVESTPIQISTVADTWIHLSYVIQGGERNRAVTVVKSRGTGHSNQVRELIFSSRGITLSDVFSAEGQVLMGTARWQKEILEQAEKEKVRAELERKRREIRSVEADIKARVEALTRELEERKAELAYLSREQEIRERKWSEFQRATSKRRGGPADRIASERASGKAAGKASPRSRKPPGGGSHDRPQH
ncbi:MAG TPA: circadian clock protein KaiC [Thermodesulfobacteriota bacterium]|nr:circadian clock protein KaiC [Thermodesulfobacteriota bacterium]